MVKNTEKKGEKLRKTEKQHYKMVEKMPKNCEKLRKAVKNWEKLWKIVQNCETRWKTVKSCEKLWKMFFFFLMWKRWETLRKCKIWITFIDIFQALKLQRAELMYGKKILRSWHCQLPWNIPSALKEYFTCL